LTNSHEDCPGRLNRLLPVRPFESARPATEPREGKIPRTRAEHRVTRRGFYSGSSAKNCRQSTIAEEEIRGQKEEEDQGDDTVHGEERGVQFGEVGFRDQGVFIGQQ